MDILIRLDNGRKFRERRKSPVESKTGSLRWGQDRERHLLRHGPEGDRDKVEREVPTIADFAPTYIERYAKAKRLKPSTIDEKETVLRRHIIPLVGEVGIDDVGEEHVGLIRARRVDLAPQTVNKIVGLLLHMHKTAARWKICPLRDIFHDRLKEKAPEIEFYEFEEYERLVTAADAASPEARIVVLLGGDAGLRRGEIIALEWDVVDLRRGLITVSRSDWEGHVGAPKGGKSRVIPMTRRLKAALTAHRHLIGARVLYRLREKKHVEVTASSVRGLLHGAQRVAGLPTKGTHTLRHTFCSHLAMRGVPARAIQELAGHADLQTTQRYMHLSPSALVDAIGVLEAARGEMKEAAADGGTLSTDHK